LFLCCWIGSGAQSDTNEVTRVSSFQATNALASFQVERGFRIEIVAAEPLVAGPVAIAFDESGRLYLAEMGQSLNQNEVAQTSGRVRLLQDRDEQGQFRTSVVFAEKLARPSALACYAGGVFVASGQDIVYLKDLTGDGVADVHQTVLSGFGGTNAPNGRAWLNNFTCGVNGRIYGATAGLGGSIVASNWPGSAMEIEENDFSFNPRTLAVFAETGPAQSGLSFDNCGRAFMCDPGRPLRLAMYDARYWLRNPFFARANPVRDVGALATPVFRFVPGASAKPGEGETNRLAAGWLTNAQGVVVYRGSIFPPDYSENAFVCDPDAHVVHRIVLRENGLEVVATRAANERNSEFLSSRDPSFRPVQALNGPEGALYIVDMQDGKTQGRIYRIVPERYKAARLPQLSSARTYDLVAALAQTNGWLRDTAARLLFERQDAVAGPLLGAMLTNSSVPMARVHALYALTDSGTLTEGHVLKALQDAHACVRQHGLVAAESVMTNGTVSDALWNQLKQLVADPSVRVRCQLAFTIGAARQPEKPLVLGQILMRDPVNDLMQTAVLSSLGDGTGSLLQLLGREASIRNDPAGLAFLRRLTLMIGTKGRLDEVGQAIALFVHAQLEPIPLYTLIYALGDGLHRTRSGLALVDPQGLLAPVSSQALLTATDTTAAEVLRVEAVRMVGVSAYTFTDTSDWLLALCNPQPSAALRSAAIEALCRYDDPRVVSGLLERWAGFTPLLRRQAVMSLLARSNRIPAVLTAVERGGIARVDFPSIALNFLRTHPSPTISERALKLFGPVPVHRPELLERFKPAISSRGDPGRGRGIFAGRCAACHEIGGSAQLIGPDLAGARTRGKERLLSAIVEPNAAVTPEYATCVLETEEGENLVGIKKDENMASVTLQQPGAAPPMVWPRLNVRSVQTQSWSIMPDGLEEGLTTQDMADLLEYLMAGAR
jgi:putative membrane-bound dehydrogenase-like protein